MLKDPGTRRKLAVFGLLLGFLGIVGVLWAVLLGDAEWWSLIVLIPVLAVMRRLGQVVRASRSQR